MTRLSRRLRPLGRIAAGRTVLIHAAAGGTGQAAVKMAKHYGATVIATASPGRHETARVLGADHVLDSRAADLAAEVLPLTDGAGADLVLESAGGAALGASLTAARRVTGRVVVYGAAGGEAPLTNWDLIYKHQVQLIGLNIGTLIQAAPQVYGELMGELFALIAAGVLTPSEPVTYELADGPKALAELEARATAGRAGLATRANGQPAAAVYTRDEHGNYQPYGICVLTVTGQGIGQIRSLADPSLVILFEPWLDRA